MKILIADDQMDNLNLLETVLVYEKYEVATALNGEDALERIKSEQFDMVISDILMPEMDGYTLCVKMKSDTNLKLIPFIFITATYLSATDRKFALSLGADAFIEKPVDVDELFNIIHTIEEELSSNTYQPNMVTDYDNFNKVHLKYILKSSKDKSEELELLLEKQEKMQNEIKASETLFRKMFDDSVDGMIMGDRNANIIKCNKAMSKYLGYSHEELLKNKITKFYHPDDIEQTKACAERLFEDHSIGFTEEKRVVHKNGRVFWCEATLFALQDENGKFKYAVARYKDITKQKHLRQELNKTVEFLKTIYDNSEVGIFVVKVDGVGNFTYEGVNKSHEKLFGFKNEDIVGKSPEIVGSMYGKEAVELIYNTYNQCVQTKMPYSTEHSLIMPDGRQEWWISTITPLFDESQTVCRLIGSSVNITDRINTENEKKTLEKRLQKAQKLESIGTMAGGIAHDFNNILYPILGFTQMSISDLPDDDPIQENLEDILQGAKRATKLVKQILLFSSQREPEQKILPVQPLIHEALKLLRSIIPTNIEIHQEVCKNEIFVFANPTEIHEIIMNLCTNAYHAMEDTGGVLKITLNEDQPTSAPKQKAERYCCLIISDTGCGIHTEIIEKIFDPYFSTKEHGKGTGLGLSVVHGIVQSYNGVINVQSESDKGTKFIIYLPVTSLKDIESEVESKDECAFVKCDENILFVDDDEPIVKLGSRLLGRKGYKVTAVTSSVEAFELFKSNPDGFDLVITDMTMPGLLGTQLAQKMLKIRSNIPILVCTGFSDKINKETIQSFGIQGYINKPILYEELSSKVRELLDQAKKE